MWQHRKPFCFSHKIQANRHIPWIRSLQCQADRAASSADALSNQRLCCHNGTTSTYVMGGQKGPVMSCTISNASHLPVSQKMVKGYNATDVRNQISTYLGMSMVPGTLSAERASCSNTRARDCVKKHKNGGP